MTLPRSMATQLRLAVTAIAAASPDLVAACGRDEWLVVLPYSLQDAVAAGRLPITVMDVRGDVRIGGTGDRRRATLALACFADGNTGQDLAEGMAALWRTLLTEPALEPYHLACPIITPSEDDGDAFDLRDVPSQLGRAQLALSVAASLIPA